MMEELQPSEVGVPVSKHAVECSPPVDLSRIIVIPKLSLLDWQKESLQLSREEVLEKLERQGANTARILESHETQQQSLRSLEKVLSPEQFQPRTGLTPEALADAQVVIALGGDNHLTFVSHYLTDQLLLGVNSDPGRSVGALTSCIADDFHGILDGLSKGTYEIQEWGRLSAAIDGHEVGQCTSEFYIGETERPMISRLLVRIGDQEEELKCSGMLLTTGAGSTGWYNSSVRFLHPEGDQFARTAQLGRFLAMEPFRGQDAEYKLAHGEIKPGETLEVQILSHHRPMLNNDAVERIDLHRGSKVSFKLSDTPLRVVVPL